MYTTNLKVVLDTKLYPCLKYVKNRQENISLLVHFATEYIAGGTSGRHRTRKQWTCQL